MNRALKRVPLDFDYPLNKVWYGYRINHITRCHSNNDGDADHCTECRKMASLKGIEISDYGCPFFDDYFQSILKELEQLCEPPVGDGYQLWEYTSLGSPISPVFDSFEKLCEWCEVNANVFANFTLSKEEWKQLLSNEPNN